MYITEWGAGGNPGGMGGTIGFEAANDWFLNQISGYLGIAAICKEGKMAQGGLGLS